MREEYVFEINIFENLISMGVNSSVTQFDTQLMHVLRHFGALHRKQKNS